MRRIEEDIPGYDFGTAARSPVTLDELEALEIAVGFTEDDWKALQMAGEVLADQTAQIVEHWRVRVIGGIPHLAKHSRTPDGQPIPEYSKRSGLRFQQWILDTCQRPYDQKWLDYQEEIALRHTRARKNQTDGADSTCLCETSSLSLPS